MGFFYFRASVENLTTDINSLAEKVESAVKTIDSVGRDFKKQMSEFLKVNMLYLKLLNPFMSNAVSYLAS